MLSVTNRPASHPSRSSTVQVEPLAKKMATTVQQNRARSSSRSAHNVVPIGGAEFIPPYRQQHLPTKAFAGAHAPGAYLPSVHEISGERGAPIHLSHIDQSSMQQRRSCDYSSSFSSSASSMASSNSGGSLSSRTAARRSLQLSSSPISVSASPTSSRFSADSHSRSGSVASSSSLQSSPTFAPPASSAVMTASPISMSPQELPHDDDAPLSQSKKPYHAPSATVRATLAYSAGLHQHTSSMWESARRSLEAAALQQSAMRTPTVPMAHSTRLSQQLNLPAVPPAHPGEGVRDHQHHNRSSRSSMVHERRPRQSSDSAGSASASASPSSGASFASSSSSSTGARRARSLGSKNPPLGLSSADFNADGTYKKKRASFSATMGADAGGAGGVEDSSSRGARARRFFGLF